MQTSLRASTIWGQHCRGDLKRSGELEDLEQAIQLNQQAVNLTPDGHADKARTPQPIWGLYCRGDLNDQESWKILSRQSKSTSKQSI